MIFQNRISRDNFILHYAHVLIGVVSVLVLVLIWNVASKFVDSVIFPSPSDTLSTLMRYLLEGDIFSDVKISVERVMIGWFFAAVLGTVVGFFVGWNKVFAAIIEPVNDFFRYLPVPAFIPIMIMWLGVGELSKLSVIFIGTIVQVIVMVSDVVRDFEQKYIDVARLFTASRAAIMVSVVFKGVQPLIWDIYKVTLGWAWTYLIVAELVAANEGLGYRILKAQRFLQTNTIFAYLIVIGIIGLLTDQIFRRLRPVLFKYTKGTHGT